MKVFKRKRMTDMAAVYRKGRPVLALLMILILMLMVMPCADVMAVNYFESDGVSYREGYIFLGESHMEIASTHMLDNAGLGGTIPGLDGIQYEVDWKHLEGGSSEYVMRGNLFFVFGGVKPGNEAAVQTDKNYIYSDGKGNHGIGVAKIHEVIDKNPNVEHWNIISYHGSVQAARMRDRQVADYYVDSYRNWIEYEFPEANVYFLSLSTMTKFYRSSPNPHLLNQVLKETFPDHFLDYTEFYNARYPQEMWDAKQRSDTLHWNAKTYVELITSVIQEIQQRCGTENADIIPVTAVEAIRYTTSDTVIYTVPAQNGKVLFHRIDAGLPVHVTGVTENGFYRIDLGQVTAYVPMTGLSEQ